MAPGPLIVCGFAECSWSIYQGDAAAVCSNRCSVWFVCLGKGPFHLHGHISILFKSFPIFPMGSWIMVQCSFLMCWSTQSPEYTCGIPVPFSVAQTFPLLFMGFPPVLHPGPVRMSPAPDVPLLSYPMAVASQGKNTFCPVPPRLLGRPILTSRFFIFFNVAK